MNDSNKLLPILIIPGFMSSGLEIKQSTINKNWEGKRIWLNLTSLGFESFTKNGTVNIKNIQEEKNRRDDYHKELKENESIKEKQIECVNQWIHHMCLSKDMCSEHDGIQVRAISGLEGVDYLTPGALTNHLSYVFGPVIKALKNVGYTDKNLDAAPYDWRLDPVTLQQRDEYFDIIKTKVEKLYHDNQTGVLLLCHSLGCKTGHYFLNFMKCKCGQKWIDKYVHTYMPVGGPHLGAPKAIRATVNGDKMGLDAFLSDDEGLVLGRSFGSGPWLYPSHLPSVSLTTSYLRNDGILSITLGNIDFSPFLKHRNDTTAKLRIAVYYGKDMLCTEFKSPNSNTYSYYFNERFLFAIPYSSSPKLDYIKVVVYEQGLGFSRQMSKTGPYYSWYCWPLRTSYRILICPFKYVCCCPCLYLYRTLNGMVQAGAQGTDFAGAQLGGSSIIASSSKIYLSQMLKGRKSEITKELVINASHVNNSKGGLFRKFFRKQTYVKINARMNWQREPCVSISNNKNDVAISIPSPQSPSTEIKPYHPKDLNVAYNVISGNALLENEGLLPQIQKHLLKCYESDPIGPRTISAIDAPPVKYVKAIYGINLPTEVSVVYKRANVLEGGGKVHKLHDIDTSAKIRCSDKCYKISNGIILETKNTPQQLKNRVLYRSGDGTGEIFILLCT